MRRLLRQPGGGDGPRDGARGQLAAGVLALTLAASTPAAAQRHFPPDEAIREIARQAGTISGKVGIVIGVLEADGTRRVITVGDAPYDGRTLFEIGSITKVFTGILLAEMAERGEVRLEQPVAELLPAVMSWCHPATAGRSGSWTCPPIRPACRACPTTSAPATLAIPTWTTRSRSSMTFCAGTNCGGTLAWQPEYSNVGVGLLGHALARRAGTSYEALVTARILAPLGMTSTRITLSPCGCRETCAGSQRARPGRCRTGIWRRPLPGAGALRSNVDDMLTFLAANLTPPESSTLGRAIRRAQTAHFTGGDGRKGGLGWGLSLLKQERDILTHAGGTGGYLTFVALDPERRLGVVVLSNQVPDVSRIGLHLLDSRIPVSLAAIERPFTVLPVILALLLVAGVFVAWRRTGASRRRSILAAAGMTVGLTVWMAATYLAAAFRLLHFPPAPPTMMVVFVLVFVLSVGLGVSPVGRRLAAGLPLAVLVGVQAFRLPLELMMHRAMSTD